jgi:hypothetical protein
MQQINFVNLCANYDQIRCEPKKFVIVFTDDLETTTVSFSQHVVPLGLSYIVASTYDFDLIVLSFI